MIFQFSEREMIKFKGKKNSGKTVLPLAQAGIHLRLTGWRCKDEYSHLRPSVIQESHFQALSPAEP